MINSQKRSIYIEKVYMIDFNTEYFSNGNYFFLKDRGDKISLYYSNADTLTESRKNDDRMDFDKKNSKNVKTMINNILKSKKKLSKGDIKKRFDRAKTSGEIEELVDDDGTMLSSKIPNINHALTPRKTMDQTVQMSRTTNDPVMRGYRVYYGESEEGTDEVINEVDYSEAFGYEETKDMDFKNTVKTLKKMGVENAVERAKEFGKLPNQKKEDGELRQRLSEKETLEERQHRLMKKMVEDILTKKPKTDSDVIKKDTGVSKILLKNIQSIKKIADKEGISLNMLIKALKTNE
jgi:hypothetical protein